MTTSVSWCISIEGIGDDPSKPAGIGWYFGDRVPADTDYEWVRDLDGLPSPIETYVDPRSGRFELSSYTFVLHASALVTKRLLWAQTRASTTLVDVTDSATTLTTSPADAGLAGEVVWCEDEAILMGTHTGSGTYTGCTRAYWGTTAQEHADNRALFTAQSYHRFRLVRMGTVDVAGDVTWRWRGWIDDIATNEDGLLVEVSCRELFGALTAVELASARYNLARLPGSTLQWIARRSRDESLLLAAYLDGEVDFRGAARQRVHKPDVSRRRVVWADGALITLASDYSCDGASIERLGSKIDLSLDDFTTEIDQTTLSRQPRAIREVALWSRELDELFVGASLDPVSPTYALNALGDGYAYHPLAIAATLLLSTTSTTSSPLAFDMMGEGWGGELEPFTASSVLTDILQLVEDSRELQVETFVLGWEEGGFRLWQTVFERLMRPYGFYLVFDEQGRFTFARLGLMDVAEYDRALDNSVQPIFPRQRWEGRLAESTGKIVATVGALPWLEGDGQRAEVRARGVSRRQGVWGEARVAEYDYSSQPTAALQGGQGSLFDRLVNEAALLYDTLPILHVKVDDHTLTGADYTMGEWVTLDMSDVRDALLVDSTTGERTRLGEGAQFAGLIVARAFSIEDHTYDLGLLLTNARVGQAITWRAPSMVVKSVNTGELRIDCAAASVFGAVDDDAQAFTAGQTIELWEPDGERWADSVVTEIAEVTTEALVLASWFDSDPTQGLIVRLAKLADYVEVVHDNVDRTYAYHDQGDVHG